MASNAPASYAAATLRRHRTHRAAKPAVAMGGPEKMEGKVVARGAYVGRAKPAQ